MNQIKVLVIDDQADMDVVARLLQSAGYDAVFLHNDEKSPLQEHDVVTALQGVDILLTDGCMTGLDGSDMIRIALEQGLSLDHVFVLTGFLKEDLRERILALGVTQILEKPIKPADLKQAIDEVCQNITKENTVSVKRLLIVDKDEAIIDVSRKFLQPQGYEIISLVAKPGLLPAVVAGTARRHRVNRAIIDAGVLISADNKEATWDVLQVVAALMDVGVQSHHIVVWGAMGRTDLQNSLISLGVIYYAKPVATGTLILGLERQ
jgi:CheY-like chemotaxis protein